MKIKPIDSSLIEDFISHLMFERRLSSHTCIAYRNDIEHFFIWAETKKNHDFLALITHHDLREYLYFCVDNYKKISIARRLSAVRSFFKYLVKIQKIKSSPADLIENPEFIKPLPKPVSLKEAFVVCDANTNDDAISVRNIAICELLYASGIRISELCNLDINNLDLKERLIKVTGKRKKERIVPIHTKCAHLLSKWLTEGRNILLDDPQKNHEKAVFIGDRGERIDPRVVRAMLSKLGKSLGINSSLHPHRLRHAYATHMLENGADLKSIQELLGHFSLSSTERYTEIDTAALMQLYEKSHPHSSKK